MLSSLSSNLGGGCSSSFARSATSRSLTSALACSKRSSRRRCSACSRCMSPKPSETSALRRSSLAVASSRRAMQRCDASDTSSWITPCCSWTIASWLDRNMSAASATSPAIRSVFFMAWPSRPCKALRIDSLDSLTARNTGSKMTWAGLCLEASTTFLMYSSSSMPRVSANARKSSSRSMQVEWSSSSRISPRSADKLRATPISNTSSSSLVRPWQGIAEVEEECTVVAGSEPPLSHRAQPGFAASGDAVRKVSARAALCLTWLSFE
mmetsp:Transcript_32262/g.92888  ORF Transcript_32262/g.92888 Transcript_32262/m.92888 type:complete len:267 (-) Transcript_32262:214-1014(-)